jgi:hypothetical protein
MRQQYRRYWGERRHNWYRAHRGRDWECSRYAAGSGVIRTMQGPRDCCRRIVKEFGSVVVTTTGATAGVTAVEIAMTNATAVMAIILSVTLLSREKRLISR